MAEAGDIVSALKAVPESEFYWLKSYPPAVPKRNGGAKLFGGGSDALRKVPKPFSSKLLRFAATLASTIIEQKTA